MPEMSDGKALLFIYEWNQSAYRRRDEKDERHK